MTKARYMKKLDVPLQFTTDHREFVEIPEPQWARIYFKFNEGEICVSMRGDKIIVSGDEKLKILPVAANVIHVNLGTGEKDN